MAPPRTRARSITDTLNRAPPRLKTEKIPVALELGTRTAATARPHDGISAPAEGAGGRACAPFVPAAWTGTHGLAAKLQVIRPTCEGAPGPSRGGRAGSNPVGATTEHQYNTASDLYE
jgi:hypothetical protein